MDKWDKWFKKKDEQLNNLQAGQTAYNLALFQGRVGERPGKFHNFELLTFAATKLEVPIKFQLSPGNSKMQLHHALKHHSLAHSISIPFHSLIHWLFLVASFSQTLWNMWKW